MELQKVSSGNLQLQPAQVQRAMALTAAEVSNLGVTASQGLSTIPNKMLANVRASDAGEVGVELNQLVAVAKGLDPTKMNQTGVISRVRNMFSTSKERMLGQFNTAEKQMDALVVSLDSKIRGQAQSIKDMDALYIDNMHFHQNLEADVVTANVMLEDLTAYIAANPEADDSFGAQLLADKVQLLDRVERKISSLELSMTQCKQFAAQIRLSQNNAHGLVQASNEVKTFALPAWKSAFTLYLNQLEQASSAALANAVSEASDTALRKGADMLRQNSVEIARLNQRSVISIETLQHVQTQLLGSLEDIRQINEAGRAKRAADKPLLIQMEKELMATFAPGQR